MSRLARVITAQNRAEIIKAVEQAPLGARIELISDLRTLAQNKMMWALLGQLSEQLKHCGEYYMPEDWKAVFLKAMGKTIRFVPALDGDGVVAVGFRSSKLSKEEMWEMVERIFEYGATHGVDFDARQGKEGRGKARSGYALAGQS